MSNPSSTAGGTAQKQLPALLGETGRARTLVDDVIVRVLLPLLGKYRYEKATDQDKKPKKGRGRRRGNGNNQFKRVFVSRADRIKFLWGLVVMSDVNQMAPYLKTTDWRREFPRPILTVMGDQNDKGGFTYTAEGHPMVTEPFQRSFEELVGSTMIPGNRPGERVNIQTRPLVMLDGRGGVLPYLTPKVSDGQTHWVGVDGMLTFTVRDINPRTWEPKTDRQGRPVYKDVPVALASPGVIELWNKLVDQRSKQYEGYKKEAELIVPFLHNLEPGARKVLKFTPKGHPDYQRGCIGISKPPRRWRNDAFDFQTDCHWVLERIFGKSLRLGRRTELIKPERGNPWDAQKLAVTERWGEIMVDNADSLWTSTTRVGTHEVKSVKETIRALSVLGWLVTHSAPAGVIKKVQSLINGPLTDDHPVVQYLKLRGDINDETPDTVVRKAVRAMQIPLTTAAGTEIVEAMNHIVAMLSIGGPDAGTDKPKLEDLVEDTSPASLRALLARTDEDAFATWMLTTPTMESYAIEEWTGSWIELQCRQKLLREMIDQQGLSLEDPPPPAADQEDAREDERTDTANNGTSEPSIIWNPQMNVPTLLELAREAQIDGVNTKTRKGALIEALSAVCEATPPA